MYIHIYIHITNMLSHVGPQIWTWLKTQTRLTATQLREFHCSKKGGVGAQVGLSKMVPSTNLCPPNLHEDVEGLFKRMALVQNTPIFRQASCGCVSNSPKVPQSVGCPGFPIKPLERYQSHTTHSQTHVCWKEGKQFQGQTNCNRAVGKFKTTLHHGKSKHRNTRMKSTDSGLQVFPYMTTPL